MGSKNRGERKGRISAERQHLIYAKLQAVGLAAGASRALGLRRPRPHHSQQHAHASEPHRSTDRSSSELRNNSAIVQGNGNPMEGLYLASACTPRAEPPLLERPAASMQVQHLHCPSPLQYSVLLGLPVAFHFSMPFPVGFSSPVPVRACKQEQQAAAAARLRP